MGQLFNSLRVRLILLVVFALLPALGLMLYSGLEQRRLAAVAAQDEALRLARLAAHEQEQLIGQAHQILAVLAQIASPRSQIGAERCGEFLATLLAQNPAYTGFSVATPAGDVVCSAPLLTAPLNFADRAWYQRLVQTNRFVASDYQVGRISGQAAIVLAYPVLDGDQLQAILTAGLDLAWLGRWTGEIQLPTGSVFTVIDRRGTILARSPDGEAWVGERMPEAPIVQAVLARGEGTAEAAGVDGVPRLYAFVPLAYVSDQDAGSYVSVGIPAAVAYAAADRALRRNLFLLGLVALVTLAAAWVGSDLLVLRQVRGLVAATRRLAAGDLAARGDVLHRDGEIGQLAHAFDQMAEALEQRAAARRQAEEALRRANRALRTLSEANQVLVRATEETALLQEICRIVVEIGGYRMAWVGFPEQDATKSVRPVARAGQEAGYLEAIGITWSDDERGAGPTGTAIRTGQVAMARDIRTDPNFTPWREPATQRGYAAAIGLPLLAGPQVLGALSVYAGEADAFGEEEVRLLAELAGDLAFGLSSLRTRAEHARAEAALRESEARYHLLFDTMLNGFALHEILCDEAGRPNDYRFLEVNPAFERLTGLRAAAIVGKTVRQVLPGIEPTWIDTYGRVALSGEPAYFEDHSQELDRYYEVSAFRPKAGQFATVFQDVSQRRRAEAALRESEARFQDLLRALDDVVWAASADGSRILYINAAAGRLYGRPLSEFSEHPGTWVEAVHPEDRERVEAESRALYERGTVEMEYRIVRPDGQVRWISDRKHVMFDAAGAPVQLGGIASDITGRKQAEAALQAAKDELEQRVAERTAELRAAQEQLVHRERLVVLGQLAGGVAHEMRNPLGAISNALYFLAMALEEPEAEVAETLQILEREVHNCNRIIGSLLDFARPREPALQRVDLGQLVQGVLAHLDVPGQVEVITRFDATTPEIPGDPDQLEIVCANLARNAVQAMREGGRLEIAVAPASAGVTLTFRDSGVGIPARQMERLFEPLFTTKAKGIGLGLALSRQLVEGHGGRITVESAEGQGATFTVTLPPA